MPRPYQVDSLPGSAKKIFQHYPNLEAIKEAPLEELAAIPCFNQKVAERLKVRLAGEKEAT